MRSTTVVGVALLLVLGGIGGPIGAATASATPDTETETYVVEQGAFCQPIDPLETNESVESFYDYRNHETHPEDVDRRYSSYGTQHLQADDTSILMLHEGSDGVSLVMVHDRLDGETAGGVVTFDIVGTPADAEWVVQDDKYDSVTNMAEWDDGDGWLGASWIWTDGRTDGGAIQGGLDDAFAVTIQPAFNEDSPFYDNDDLYNPDWHGGGEISQWEILSGDSDAPDRTALPSLEEPVTIRTGSCDGPTVTYDRGADGINATVGGVTANGHSGLHPVAGSSDAVQFDAIQLTDVDPDGTVATHPAESDEFPALPADVEALSKLTLESDMDVSSGTATFGVAADRLQAAGVEASEVALFETDGTDWREAETTVGEAGDGTYEFEATVRSLDGLAVTVPQETDSESDSESSGDRESENGDEQVTEAETDAGDGTDPTPGGGPVVVATVAVLLSCGALWRRWQRSR